MIKKFFSNKKIWIPIVVVLILVAGFFVYQGINQGKSAANSLYQTSPLARGSLTATVGATGTVRAKQTALLNWQTTGTVESILVKVGDNVAERYRLAKLSRLPFPNRSSLPRLIWLQQNAIWKIWKNPIYPPHKRNKHWHLLRKHLDDAKDERESKKFTKADQSTIDTAYANYILAKEEMENVEDDYFGTQYMAEDDPTRASAISKYSAALKNVDTALANYNYAKSYPDELEQAEIDANFALAEAKVNDAQREYDRLKNGADPEDIAAARARVAATEATLKMAYLEAPFAGTVTVSNPKLETRFHLTSTGFPN